MNLKSSITATHETKPKAKKTAETEFSSLQHLHGMEINLHQKSTPKQHPWNRVVWGKTHQATLLISVVVRTLTLASSEVIAHREMPQTSSRKGE
jgi:hypothetical protein